MANFFRWRGILGAEGCKSVEPIAAMTAPAGVSVLTIVCLHGGRR
jgi:hypothetical protein